MKSTPGVSIQAVRLALLFLALLIAAGCVPKYKGPLLLYPGQTDSKGYSIDDNSLIFDNDDVKITVTQVTSADESKSFLVDDLIDLKYLLIRVEIENRTRYKILFNPALASLRDSKAGYKKPLDYTDFYQKSATEKGFPEDISDMSKIFYDLTAEIPSGKKRSKILVFDQIEEGADEAELVIKNLYLGRNSMDLTFPFILKPREPKKDKEEEPIE
ncbi:MAG: hypothetical protein ACE5EB_05275 [Thermodesulfobacteriota bacterium]